MCITTASQVTQEEKELIVAQFSELPDCILCGYGISRRRLDAFPETKVCEICANH